MSKKKKYYAYVVPSREKQGITDSWMECDRHVKGVQGARYRAFSSRELAAEWLHGGGEYEKKPPRVKPRLLPGVYFDAGTGRGEGVEVSVTDEKGVNLLPKVLPRAKLNRFGKHLVAHADATNNYGELLALKYALKFAMKEEEKSIFGDSKLVIDHWSKYQIKRKAVAPKTVKLAEEVSKLREEFEADGGVISRVSGADNPADLGFHR